MKVLTGTLLFHFVGFLSFVHLSSQVGRKKAGMSNGSNTNTSRYTVYNGYINPRVTNPDNLIRYGNFIIGVRDQDGWHTIQLLNVALALGENGEMKRPLNDVERNIILTRRFPRPGPANLEEGTNSRVSDDNIVRESQRLEANTNARRESNVHHRYSSSSGSNGK